MKKYYHYSYPKFYIPLLSQTEADTSVYNRYYAKAQEADEINRRDSSAFYYESAANSAEKLRLTTGDATWAVKEFNCLNKFTFNTSILGNSDTAVILLKKSMSLISGLPNPEQFEASYYFNMGSVYLDLGRYDSAQVFALKALNLSEKISDRTDRKVSEIYNLLGLIYDFSAQYKKSFDAYMQVLSIEGRNSETETKAIGDTYHNIGMALFKLNDLELAEQYLNRSIDIRNRAIGHDNLDNAATYNNLALIYKQKGDSDAALRYFHAALNLYKSRGIEYHPYVANFYNNIGSVYNSTKESELAYEYITKPIADNTTDEGRVQNRRVEIKLL